MLIVVILVTPLIAGCYGVLHDQLTYTISHEYFTKFKFFQFGFANEGKEAHLATPRLWVAAVGFLATWWVGLILGIGHGMVGLIQKDYRAMLKIVGRAIIINLATAFVSGLTGLAYGWFYLSAKGVNWYLPETLIDKQSYIAVGSIHNFGYLGGLIGLVTGMAYQVFAARQTKNNFRYD